MNEKQAFSTIFASSNMTVDNSSMPMWEGYPSPMNENKREMKVTMPKKSFAKFHFNPRMALGVILIATSFISAYVISETNNRMTIVWSAVTDLAPGEIIEASDVIKSRVLLPNNASYYLDGSTSIIGNYVVRPLGASELIPAYGVSTEFRTQLRRIPIALPRSRIPTGVKSGSQIDIYGLPKNQFEGNIDTKSDRKSQTLLTNVSVDAIDFEASKMGGEIGITILVPEETIPRFISSMTEFDFIVVKRI